MNARQIKRLENKKRKMDALLEIKTLNDADKQIKKSTLGWDDKLVKKKTKLMLYLKHQGESAIILDTGLPQSRIPLFVSDIRDFLLYLVFNKTCPPYTEPRWCNISKKTINHTILLVNEGLSLNDYLRYTYELPGLRDRFVKLEVVPPSSYATSLVHELVMSSRQRESLGISPSKSNKSPSKSPNSDLTDFCKASDTIKSAFPINSKLTSSTPPGQSAKSSISNSISEKSLNQSKLVLTTKTHQLSTISSKLVEQSSLPVISSYTNNKSCIASTNPLSINYKEINTSLSSSNTHHQSSNSSKTNMSSTHSKSNVLSTHDSKTKMSLSTNSKNNLSSTNDTKKSSSPSTDMKENTTSGDSERSSSTVSKQSVSPSTDSSSEVPAETTPDRFPRTMLLLSALQMIEEDYPIPLRGELSARFSKYQNTKAQYSEVTPHSPLYSLDCEMCQTAHDQTELTRVTLVDELENVVYESLVKPYNPITNYLTPYSGITRALLDPVATRLEHVQAALGELLPSDAILVGQSLNCDLHALKMMHPYVIDTSVIFNTAGSRTQKPKLRLLASHFLGLDIQGRTSGHCSREDAVAALRLVKLKLSKDPQFGDSVALQKCIRNVNSKLSTQYEVLNLFAYFDKIVTRKQDALVEKTASVLTTEHSAETLYKKYLQTYRTKCQLINPNSRRDNLEDTTSESSEKTSKENANKQLVNENVNLPSELSDRINSDANKSKTNNTRISLNSYISETSTDSISTKNISCKRKLSSDSFCVNKNPSASPSLIDLTENQDPIMPKKSKIDLTNRSANSRGDSTRNNNSENHRKPSAKSHLNDSEIEDMCLDADELEDAINDIPDSGRINGNPTNITQTHKVNATCKDLEIIEDFSQTAVDTTETFDISKTRQALSSTHKDLIDEMLRESHLKSLVIGHTRQPDRKLLQGMVETLEAGLSENQLLVVLCVPSSETDHSSGVCFVHANSC